MGSGWRCRARLNGFTQKTRAKYGCGLSVPCRAASLAVGFVAGVTSYSILEPTDLTVSNTVGDNNGGGSGGGGGPDNPPGGPNTCSFSSDTPVATDNGEAAIGDLKVGDHVLAYDPKSGQTGSYAVDAVLVHTDPVIEDLTLDGETLQTTPEHPFFTQDRGFTAAGELTIGEHIRKADGSFGVVKALKFVARAQRMYDLTIHTAHTFFVGTARWLVHNMCKPIEEGGGGTSKPDKPPYKANPAHDPSSNSFNHNKNPEPSDAATVYADNSTIPSGKYWYGRGNNGEIYRFSPDNVGTVHFSGMTGGEGKLQLRLEDIPIGVRRALGKVR